MSLPDLSRLADTGAAGGDPLNEGNPHQIQLSNGVQLVKTYPEVSAAIGNYFLTSDPNQLGRGADASAWGHKATTPVAIYTIVYPPNHPLVTRFDALTDQYRRTTCPPEVVADVEKYKGAFSASTKALAPILSAAGLGATYVDTNINEQLLFHGTNFGSAAGIITNGFNGAQPGPPRLSMFGDGNYFADRPEKIDQYARGASFDKIPLDLGDTWRQSIQTFMHRKSAKMQQNNAWSPTPPYPPINDGVFPMLINRVVLGCPALVDRCSYTVNRTTYGTGPVFSLVAPSLDRTLAKPYNSLIVLNEPVKAAPPYCSLRYKEYVTYRDDAALPQFLVLYMRL